MRRARNARAEIPIGKANYLTLITIPLICHFFTEAKFLENKIYTEIYTVNCQFFALHLKKKFKPAKKNLHRHRP